MSEINRCAWCGQDPLYMSYHDQEWGIPTHDERRLFEMLLLEGAQAGLSWITILRKREHYRKVFADFDPEKIARLSHKRVESILLDPGIVRNRLKVNAFVENAKAYLKLAESGFTLNQYLWNFVQGEPIINHWRSLKEIPSQTPLSETISRDLKKKGFRFVGSTICYAYMQAIGMVNDHTLDCWTRQIERR